MNNELWSKFENHMLNEAVTKRRLKKLKQMFVTCERGIDNLETANRKTIEVFINRLNKNEFKSLQKKDYSGSTKADIKKFLKQFYKWYKGKNEYYPKEVIWIKAKISKDEQPKEKPILSIKEVIKLANRFKKLEYKLLTLMLFDSGFRIQEMLSVKKKDLSWGEFIENEKCFWLYCNESKTEKRKVPIPLFTEEIQAFVNSSYFQNLDNEELLMPQRYDNICHLMKRHSLKLFGENKIVTPHILRHSSATYYSQEYDGNMNLIAIRYGWSFSSKELKTYIRRSGAYQKAGAKKSFENEVIKLKRKVMVMEEAMSLMVELIDDPNNKLKKVEKLLNLV